jgi:phenylacetic acid degradation operon negative regulatory protein
MNESTVPKAMEALLESFRQKSRVQARSLITSVFGDAILPHGGRVWLGSLIHLLRPLDVSERLVRTTVFRLVKDQWLQAEAVGRCTDYMLTPAGRRRFEKASQQIYAIDSPVWDRRWRLIMVVGELDARQRERLRRTLSWQGFGDTGTGCFIHPSAELEAALDAVAADGQANLLPRLMPLVAVNPKLTPAAEDAQLVQRAWDLDELAISYSNFVARYQPVLDALRQAPTDEIDEQQACLTRILLIHDFRRHLLRDPQLPKVLLPSGWPGNQARLLCKALYRRLLAPSERHLGKCLQLASGDMPDSADWLFDRFRIPADALAVPG